MRAKATLLALALLAAATPAAAADLALKGLGGQARTVGEAEVAALPHVRATLDNEGKPVVYEGVRVSALLKLVGFTPGEQMRGAALAAILLFRASDGYRVALALSETDVDFRSGEVVVADRRDGKPLDPREGPFRLVIEGDKRPARSARNLVAIEMVDLR